MLLLIPLLWYATTCYLPEAEPVLQDLLELASNCGFLRFLLKGWSDIFKGILYDWEWDSPLLYKACPATLKLNLDQTSCLGSIFLLSPSFPLFQIPRCLPGSNPDMWAAGRPQHKIIWMATLLLRVNLSQKTNNDYKAEKMHKWTLIWKYMWRFQVSEDGKFVFL